MGSPPVGPGGNSRVFVGMRGTLGAGQAPKGMECGLAGKIWPGDCGDKRRMLCCAGKVAKDIGLDNGRMGQALVGFSKLRGFAGKRNGNGPVFPEPILIMGPFVPGRLQAQWALTRVWWGDRRVWRWPRPAKPLVPRVAMPRRNDSVPKIAIWATYVAHEGGPVRVRIDGCEMTLAGASLVSTEPVWYQCVPVPNSTGQCRGCTGR